MTQDSANIELVTRVHHLFSVGRDDEALAHAAPDIVLEMVAFGMTLTGQDGFRDFMKGFKTAFPDLVITPRSHVASHGRVACEFTAKGTHLGPFGTPAGAIAATGKSVHFTVCEVWEVENGKIKAIRNYQDAGSVLRQIAP